MDWQAIEKEGQAKHLETLAKYFAWQAIYMDWSAIKKERQAKDLETLAKDFAW